MPPRTPAAKKPPKTPTRRVIYPDIEVCGIKIPHERLKVTVTRMKEILGWTEEGESIKFDKDYNLVDLENKKIRLVNNGSNRDWVRDDSLKIAQDILERNWKMNGETGIIGEYGSVLSLQHRGIGLVFAAQKWAAKTEEGEHWRTIWKEEPWIELLITTGIKENRETTQTIDNVRTRDFADVLTSDPTFFGDKPPVERRVLCRGVMYTVKELWKRTGAKNDSYAPRQTHSGSFSFINRHPKIKESVLHLSDENQDNRVGKIFGSLGYTAAVLYLMATSGSNPEQVTTYRDAVEPNEDMLDTERWDEACEFWVGLSKASPDFQPVRNALKALNHPVTGEEGSRKERALVIQRAWEQFVTGKPFDEAKLTLGASDFSTPDSDGAKYQIEFANFKGIDLGESPKEEQGINPTSEEIEAEKAAIRASNGHAPEEEVKPTPAPKPSMAKPKAAKAPKPVSTPAPKSTPEPRGAFAPEDRLKGLREKHPTALLLFKKGGWYTAWGKDGTATANLLGVKPSSGALEDRGLVKMEFTTKDYPRVIDLLVKDGRNVAIVDGDEVEYLKNSPQPSEFPTPTKAKKPKAVKPKLNKAGEILF